MTHPRSRELAHPAPARHLVGPAALWFGLFGAPAVWSVQLMLGYALAAHACYPEMTPRLVPVIPGLWALELVISLVALAIGAGAAVVAIRSWRAARPRREAAEARLLEVAEGRVRFMALAGVLVSMLFLLGILANGLPLFLVGACA